MRHGHWWRHDFRGPRCNKTHRFIMAESSNYIPAWHYTLSEYLACAPREIREPLIPFFPSARVLGPAFSRACHRPSLFRIVSPKRVYEIFKIEDSSLLHKIASRCLIERSISAYKGLTVGNLFILISRYKIEKEDGKKYAHRYTRCRERTRGNNFLPKLQFNHTKLFNKRSALKLLPILRAEL